jgi:FKBP-type peptidyl-prolyl cis-trans isomerase FkpA
MTKKKNLGSIIWVLGAALFFVACDRVTYKKFPDGTPFAVINGKHDKGDTQKVAVGKYIQVHVIQKRKGSTKKDSMLMNTYETGIQGVEIVAEMLDTANPQVKKVPLIKTLIGLQAGDSVIIKPSIAKIVKENAQAESQLGKKGTLEISYKIHKIYNSAKDYMSVIKKEKQAEFDAYISKNNLASSYVAADSIYVTKKSAAAAGAPTIKNNNYVKVNYTGRLLSGKIFDSNIEDVPGRPSNPGAKQPLAFTVGAKQMIPGFDAAMKYLTKGEKASIVLPYNKAYGEMGNPGGIGPFETLVFDIEVVSVEDKAPEQPKMPMPPTSGAPQGAEQHGPNDGHDHDQGQGAPPPPPPPAGAGKQK